MLGWHRLHSLFRPANLGVVDAEDVARADDQPLAGVRSGVRHGCNAKQKVAEGDGATQLAVKGPGIVRRIAALDALRDQQLAQGCCPAAVEMFLDGGEMVVLS